MTSERTPPDSNAPERAAENDDSLDKFKRLTRGLLGVSRDELAKAEEAEKQEKQKPA